MCRSVLLCVCVGVTVSISVCVSVRVQPSFCVWALVCFSAICFVWMLVLRFWHPAAGAAIAHAEFRGVSACARLGQRPGATVRAGHQPHSHMLARSAGGQQVDAHGRQEEASTVATYTGSRNAFYRSTGMYIGSRFSNSGSETTMRFPAPSTPLSSCPTHRHSLPHHLHRDTQRRTLHLMCSTLRTVRKKRGGGSVERVRR